MTLGIRLKRTDKKPNNQEKRVKRSRKYPTVFRLICFFPQCHKYSHFSNDEICILVEINNLMRAQS